VRIFTSDVGNFCHDKKQISAAAYALLSYAVAQTWGRPCPEIVRDNAGKPSFIGDTGMCFSISHSQSRVLVAVSQAPVGVDVEVHRQVRPDLKKRIFSPQMQENFNFFEGWTVREAVFKLTGEGGLTTMELEKRAGEIITPFPTVKCRVYASIPGCTASAASRADNFPDQIEEVSPELFLPSKAFSS
jgi:hypothetical protein